MWRGGGGVRAEIKFCGLTRAEDARTAAMCGARYAGVVFAAGARTVTAPAAREVLDGAGGAVRRAGVFAVADPDVIVAAVREAALDIVQLHGDPSVADVRRVRAATGAEVWAVVHVSGEPPAGRIAELDGEADAIVLETRVAGRLGGTGIVFDWSAAARGRLPVRSRLVVAGGLDPVNVSLAIAALAPHIVDVSSGVERAPGIKDADLMRAFADAVRAAGSE